MRTPGRILLGCVLLGCLLLTACDGATDPAAPRATALAGPEDSSGGVTGPSNTPAPDSPRDSADPVLYTYCLTEEHVVGIEARLLDKPTDRAIKDLKKAQAFVYAQAAALAEDDRTAQANAVRAWGNAFDQSIRLLRGSADPFDALMPATEALGRVGYLIDCEVDA